MSVLLRTAALSRGLRPLILQQQLRQLARLQPATTGLRLLHSSRPVFNKTQPPPPRQSSPVVYRRGASSPQLVEEVDQQKHQKQRFFDTWPMLRYAPRQHRFFWLMAFAASLLTSGFFGIKALQRRLHPSVPKALELVEEAEWFQAMVRRHNERVESGEESGSIWKSHLRPRPYVAGVANSKRETADLSIWVSTPAGPARIRAWSSRPLVEASEEWVEAQVVASPHYVLDVSSIFGGSSKKEEEAAAAKAVADAAAAAAEEAARLAAEQAAIEEARLLAQKQAEEEAAAAAAAASSSWWSWVGLGGGSSAPDAAANAASQILEVAPSAGSATSATPAAQATAPAPEVSAADKDSPQVHAIVQLQKSPEVQDTAFQKTIHSAPWQVQDITVDFPEAATRWVWDRTTMRWEMGQFDKDSIGWLEKKDLSPGPRTLIVAIAIAAVWGTYVRNRRLRPTLLESVSRHLKKQQTPAIRQEIGNFRVIPQTQDPKDRLLPIGRADSLRLQLVGQDGGGTVHVSAVKAHLYKADGKTLQKAWFSKTDLHRWKVVKARFVSNKGKATEVKLDL